MDKFLPDIRCVSFLKADISAWLQLNGHSPDEGLRLHLYPVERLLLITLHPTQGVIRYLNYIHLHHHNGTFKKLNIWNNSKQLTRFLVYVDETYMDYLNLCCITGLHQLQIDKCCAYSEIFLSHFLILSLRQFILAMNRPFSSSFWSLLCKITEKK